MSETLSAPVPTSTRELYDALDRLASCGATGDPLVCAALLRASARLEGLALREVAAVDDSGSFTGVGHGSAAAVVRAATGCTVGAARSGVRLAGRLAGDLQAMGELLVAGRVTRRHCTAVVHGVRGLAEGVVADAMPAICDAALASDPDTLARELRVRAAAISPELAAEQRRRLEARVGLTVDESPDGTGHLRGTVSPEVLALVNAILDPHVHGDRIAGDARNASRRRHDGLLEVLRHTVDCADAGLPSLHGSCRAQVTIVATAGTVAGLAGAVPARLTGTRCGLLTRDALLRLLCDALVSTEHLSADLRDLQLSRSTATVSHAQRRAVTARDLECVVRGCHRRPAQCQVHHVIHWANGGTTDIDNLVLLCHAHHHDLHDRHIWLDCTGDRVMTSVGWLDLTAAEPLTGAAVRPASGAPPR